MSKNLTASRLRKILATESKEHLLDELVELFTKFDVVQKHYATRMEPQGADQVLAEYKAHITKAMLPKSDWGEPKVSEARRLVKEYVKVALAEKDAIDVMLVYVESGVQYLRRMGDYRESFYDSLERMFEAVLKKIAENEVGAEFEHRCRKIVSQASDMGYGFGDVLHGLMEEYYESP